MKEYIDCLKKYSTFSGRARRREYWMFAVMNFIFSAAAAIIDDILGTIAGVQSLYFLAMLLPGSAVFIRRLHDTDHSAWWCLLSFLPIIGAIVLFVFMCQDGTNGPNRFGDDPKAA